MNILFIAPFPPPIDGQSLAVKFLYDHLKFDKDINITVVNTRKNNINSFFSNLIRPLIVLNFIANIFIKAMKVDIVYFNVSQSRLGNFKDLLIYLALRNNIKNTVIHLHGGDGIKKILNPKGMVSKINYFFISRLKGVIVLGEKQKNIYANFIDKNKIYIIPNFLDPNLLIDEKAIFLKFEKQIRYKVLFLSNMIIEKGYKDLFKAYLLLDEKNREKIEINYAGNFYSNRKKSEFLEQIKGFSNIKYHGVLKGDKKKKILHESHFFCLPTYYKNEGQPISLIEACGSGLVTITTKHGGIEDIVENSSGNFFIQKHSPSHLARILAGLISYDKKTLIEVAINNRIKASSRFRMTNYKNNLFKVLTK